MLCGNHSGRSLYSNQCLFVGSQRIIFSQFQDITAPVVATPGSPFWFFLDCSISDISSQELCTGSMLSFATFFFGDKFSASNREIDIGILVAWNVLALFGTWLCLMKFNYVNT